MKKLIDINNQKGLTLVEIIVSFAILAIIVGVFTSLFSTSLKGIFLAGNRSQAGFLTQDTIENRIKTGADPSATGNMVVRFTGVSDINLLGEIVTEDETVNGKTVAVTVFLPK